MDPGFRFRHLIRILSTTAPSHPQITRSGHAYLSKIFRHYTMYNVFLLIKNILFLFFPFYFTSGTNKLMIINKSLLLFILVKIISSFINFRQKLDKSIEWVKKIQNIAHTNYFYDALMCMEV